MYKPSVWKAIQEKMERVTATNELAPTLPDPTLSGLPHELQNPQIEIEASNVRSSLAEMETQVSILLNRWENVRSRSIQKRRSLDSMPDELTIPVGTDLSRKTPSEVLARLEWLLAGFTSMNDFNGQEHILPALDEVSHLAVLQHATAAYLNSFERPQGLTRIAQHLASETLTWLVSLFKFDSSHAGYFRDDAECLFHALRMALVNQRNVNRRQRAPDVVIYLSEMGYLFTVQNVCRYLGLPLACIQIVPCVSRVSNTIEDETSEQTAATGQMDINALEKLLKTDEAAGRQPLFIMATAGSPITGCSDDLVALGALCSSHNVWLHCQGLGLAALVLTYRFTPNNIWPTSLTLNLNTWLGVSGLPAVLLCQQTSSREMTLFDNESIIANRMNCLSVWSALQTLGTEAIASRIFAAFDSCRAFYQMLLPIHGINVLSKKLLEDSSEKYRNLLSNASNLNSLLQLAVPTVIFQFDGCDTLLVDNDRETTFSSSDGTKYFKKTAANAEYYDRLNSWLGQILLRDCSQLALEIIDHEQHGICIRYHPFIPGYGDQLLLATTPVAFVEVANFIRAQSEILHATIRHRMRFNDIVEESSVLRLVELNDWAGLGGVHYIPEGWETLLNDQTKAELNKLNSALVDELQSTDGAFSLGESSDGLICVRFGMVTSDTDIEELLELVISTARSIQEHSKILDTMSKILKKGIEAATIDLQREAEEKLWQEGILRQMPLVGRVVNWWSPVAKESGMKGRSLNLTQGVVESTENIYKYHMQMTPKTSNQLPSNKGPPAPLVQKPIHTIVDEIRPLRSRNPSSSSELSGSGAAVVRAIFPAFSKSSVTAAGNELTLESLSTDAATIQ
ncbi:pyridoxal-dependent decarboxylase domain-containing protein 1 isoform X2 [Anopheles bellator]|uniref:pyridoxal-dependent decarboxylase domain-containing protein 1 isoform X2 n=1 Tax=Anopheles bellator TaxID=139047 RepID=UPI002649E1E1|nr:pyridoxal-dependent decarboxylase domain-containing protein 1 isoform X2 [Anopheles bellator]